MIEKNIPEIGIPITHTSDEDVIAQVTNDLIPELNTKDKRIAGAINEVKRHLDYIIASKIVNFNITNITTDSAQISYEIQAKENHTYEHFIHINGVREKINPTVQNNVYTYNMTNLKVNKLQSCRIEVVYVMMDEELVTEYSFTFNTKNISITNFTLGVPSQKSVDVSYSTDPKNKYTFTHKLLLNGNASVITPANSGGNYSHTISGLNKATTYNYILELTANVSGEVIILTKEFTFTTKNITIYGFDINQANSDPTSAVTYTDDAAGFSPLSIDVSGTVNWGSWKDTFILQGNKPCLLKSGVRQYYLNPNDYTKKEDGSASDITSGNVGDVMAEFKKTYYKLWQEGDVIKFRVADGKVDSSYVCDAFISEDGLNAEKEFMYIACYNATNVSSRLRSISGKSPFVDHNIETARTYATGNGSGYQQCTNVKRNYLVNLITLVSKSRDGQRKIGQGRTNTSNSSALNTGTMNNKGQFWGNQNGTDGVKVFHIEHFWGNIWQFIDGLNLSSGKYAYKNIGPYNDNCTNYTVSSDGITGFGGGHIIKERVTGMGMCPSELGGSDSTYYCDREYFSTSGIRIAEFGGGWYNGSIAGPFFLDLSIDSSNASSLLGSRLSHS